MVPENIDTATEGHWKWRQGHWVTSRTSLEPKLKIPEVKTYWGGERYRFFRQSTVTLFSTEVMTMTMKSFTISTTFQHF